MKSNIRLFDEKGMFLLIEHFLWNHKHVFGYRSETGHFDVNVIRDTEISSCEYSLEYRIR